MFPPILYYTAHIPTCRALAHLYVAYTHFLNAQAHTGVAPCPLCDPEIAALAKEQGEQEMDFDADYAPAAADLAQEEREEPLMMQNAERWDHFLSLVRAMQAPWPQGEPDTDEYRRARALWRCTTWGPWFRAISSSSSLL